MKPQATNHASMQLAPIMEVFASIQGEGLFVGELQVFLRLAGCPLRCDYCDTPGSWDPTKTSRALDGDSNLRSPFQAACLIKEIEPGDARTVSVTGGEPLLWPEFLFGLKRVIGERRLHLETAGAHPKTLERVRDLFDHISLDLKLADDLAPPSEIALGFEGMTTERVPGARSSEDAAEEWAEARARSLALVRGRDACGKIVVCGNTPVEEYELLVDEVAEHAPELPLFIQPATPVRKVAAPPMSDVLQVAETARDRALNVRVLPQVHPFLNVR